ncbi:MAG: RsmE family RNA methyltransferase [Ignavibacteriaceae bacterium]|nr:RsmE family RNA methyltransferase [Ignavibacteriaceae bacterium]
MTDRYLSNIELYYSADGISGSLLRVAGEDFNHIIKVMRHSPQDIIYITDGRGNIFESKITVINKETLIAVPLKSYKYENNKKNVYFCIPKLKSPDKFEFALEKCAELGITNFIIFESKRTVSKGVKLERWNKILISAMKQSLRCFLPEIKIVKSINDIFNFNGQKIGFEQDTENKIDSLKITPGILYYLIFGPEGGLDKDELALFNPANIYNLAENRLRTETAIIKAASIL